MVTNEAQVSEDHKSELDQFWERSAEFWKQNDAFWKRFNSRPSVVTKLKSVTNEPKEIFSKCRCGCGREIEQPETGRKKQFYDASCRVRFNRRKKQ